MPRPEDYTRENRATRPRNQKVMTKTRVPTQTKTQIHNCSQCPNKYATQYQISENETRWLCDSCVIRFKNQFNNEKPNFVKAMRLSVG